ncbi:MAG: DUF4062 domain-containing protein [Lentisphaeria bacterium]|nr:DUF4062 domain-containing protein [Lentisphaeria bacterium]
MSYQAIAINVMIASPGDVATERQNIRELIQTWNAMHAEERHLILMPLGWESHASPQMGDRAQGVINEQVLGRCDLLVAVFWTRLGSPTGEAPSGTVEEINRHLQDGKPAMLYFSNAPVRPDSVDEVQYAALRDFRTDCEGRGLIETYDSIEEFRNKFARQLTQTVFREFAETQSSVNNAGIEFAEYSALPELSDESQTVLLEAAQDDRGIVACIRVMRGSIVQTNGKQLAEIGNPRSEAKWRAAIDALVAMGCLEPRGHKGEVFGLTHTGYEIADRLSQSAHCPPQAVVKGKPAQSSDLLLK